MGRSKRNRQNRKKNKRNFYRDLIEEPYYEKKSEEKSLDLTGYKSICNDLPFPCYIPAGVPIDETDALEPSTKELIKKVNEMHGSVWSGSVG